MMGETSLSEILFAVHQRTGAEVAVATGAETELVVAEYGPGPAPEVLAQLLNGSRFDFLIASSPDNPQKLDRVILSVRGSGVVPPLQPMQTVDELEPGPPVAANAPTQPAAANASPQAPANANGKDQQQMAADDHNAQD